MVDAHGQPVPAGRAGQIAMPAPDPVMFLGYWDKPEATRGKYRGDWLLTGDIGSGPRRATLRTWAATTT